MTPPARAARVTKPKAKPRAKRGAAKRIVAPEGSALAATIPLPGGARPHPVIGLGLWASGHWRTEDEARVKAATGRAWERGIRWFDTAEVYGGGRSERLLGEVLNRVPNAAPEAYVTTKVSWEHLRANQVRASLIGSLERMARRSVDLYLVHAPDRHVPLAETMGALEALWKEGRIGAIGVSNFSLEELEEASRHLSETTIVVNQLCFNLFFREDVDPVRAYCQAHGILIEAYSPLARGLLVGRSLSDTTVRRKAREVSSTFTDPARYTELLDRRRALRDLADEAGVPLSSIALHWLRKMGAAPLFGASRPEQLDADLAAWAVRPPDRVLDRADRIARGERA